MFSLIKNIKHFLFALRNFTFAQFFYTIKFLWRFFVNMLGVLAVINMLFYLYHANLDYRWKKFYHKQCVSLCDLPECGKYYVKLPLPVLMYDFALTKVNQKGDNLYDLIENGNYYIETLEGRKKITDNYYVVIGTAGEKYCLRKDIHAGSYVEFKPCEQNISKSKSTIKNINNKPCDIKNH